MKANSFGKYKEKENNIKDEIENHNNQISKYLEEIENIEKIKDKKYNSEKKKII